MDKKLEVKDLRISFRTAGGKVQAVRDISFDLYEGETLAIVGESGSGKSVTTRAIMGISALNAMIENGEILYDGNDILKYGEEDFQEIRGNKIAMIFQDPMSSLNPIVKVGKQLTEAMLLKSRTNRKNGKKDFYGMLKKLKAFIAESGEVPEFSDLSAKFVQVEKKATREEEAYLQARKNAEEAKERIDELLVAFEKKDEKTVQAKCAGIYKYATKCHNRFLTLFDDSFSADLEKLKSESDKKQALDALKDVLKKGLDMPVPDFFTIAYYEMYSGATADASDVSALNALTGEYCREFYEKLLAAAEKGVSFSAKKSAEEKRAAVPELENALGVLRGEWKKDEIRALVKSLSLRVKKCIDPLVIRKESREYTFASSMYSYCDKYFTSVVKNAREQKRFDKQTAKRSAIVAKGKQVDWKVTPASLTDLEALRESALAAVGGVLDLYKSKPDKSDDEVRADAVKLVEYLKKKASMTASKMTKTAAKRRAIRLLNEVGIPEPEERFGQYPFQLSGGQRQRIVIAIALSADPDILICDEPTTALDVTIQSQILELINKVKRERNLSVIFITHDLGVVANIADRIAVMYAGKIVEYGTCQEVFYQPAHPYTWALLSSVPDLESSERLETIPGTPPNMIYPPKGDAFAERNRYALEIDFKEQAPMFRITDTHYAATWLLHPLAPKVEIPAAVTERIQRMKKEAERE